MMIYQRTLAKEVKVTGIGLHSGRKVTLKLLPAEADFGLQFCRVDLPHRPILKASAQTVGATENATTIGNGEEAIHTVEHLLGVLYGLGLNNVLIEIDGPEIPIMDGSGASFVFLVKEAGLKNLNKTKKFLVVLDTVRVEKDGKWAQFEPNSSLVVDSTIVFAHPQIKTQREVFDYSCERFIHDICRARTFGFVKDVDYLKRRGLIKGGSLNNAIVLDDYKVINPEGLRFPNEFVRHKILDTLGDVSLLGYEIAGKITTYKSGHNLHNLLCRKLLDTPSAYEIVSASNLAVEVQEALKIPQYISVTH
jgi:UDP-3-O-[3-hydroxymyristoyl] N-acetylglucosamine deacetylase